MSLDDGADLDRKWWSQETATNSADGLPDERIVPYVNELNEAGVTTLQSCAGHVRDDGYLDDGKLWVADEDCSPELARELISFDDIMFVEHRWGPWDEPHWNIVYEGYARGEDAFEGAMEAIFDVLVEDDRKI